jgi:hypothetical protein
MAWHDNDVYCNNSTGLKLETVGFIHNVDLIRFQAI